MPRLTAVMAAQQHKPIRMGLPPVLTSLIRSVLSPMAAMAMMMKNLDSSLKGAKAAASTPARDAPVVIREASMKNRRKKGNTRRVIDWVAETFRPGEVLFSLMSQYTPQPGAEGKLARHVTKAEYRAAVEYMENCGITDGYTQERTSAREEYTPAFDLRGI